MKLKIQDILLLLLAIAFICFIKYGLDTDCPDTATYVYCGKH